MQMQRRRQEGQKKVEDKQEWNKLFEYNTAKQIKNERDRQNYYLHLDNKMKANQHNLLSHI